jgi:hypothetical protein
MCKSFKFNIKLMINPVRYAKEFNFSEPDITSDNYPAKSSQGALELVGVSPILKMRTRSDKKVEQRKNTVRFNDQPKITLFKLECEQLEGKD